MFYNSIEVKPKKSLDWQEEDETLNEQMNNK